jgi:hypothetical protein
MSSLKRRLEKLEQQEENNSSCVYFVGLENGEYTVIAAPDKLVFQGDKGSYKAFTQQCGAGSVFIVDDIPREVTGINLLDWTV